MSTPTETTAPASTPVAPRNVLIAAWIWIIGSVISVLGAAVAAVSYPEPLLIGLLLGSAAQAAVAIPAALLVRRGGRNWARIVLFILAAFSIGSLYQSLSTGAWPSLILNLVLGSTIGMLSTAEAKQHCRRAPNADAFPVV